MSLEDQVRQLRSHLEGRQGDESLERSLSAAIADLHNLPEYRSMGSLKPSSFSYGTDRLLDDSGAMSSKFGKLLIHGQPVQVLDPPSMLLHRPPKKKRWALYNPSLLPVQWRGEDVFLMTYRAGTWQLCTWDGRSSPVSKLPVVEGKNQATSKVMAAIVRKDFSPLVPVHELADQGWPEHSCTHSTGMRRVGIDDGRLFLLAGQPWLLIAGVAPKGQDYPCQHRQYLCPLELPDDSTAIDPKELRVRCKRKVLLSFEYADRFSEKMKSQERLGSVHQKNWMPFVVADQLYLAFTIEPLRVMRVDTDTGLCSEVGNVRTPALSALYTPERDEIRGHGGPALLQLPASHGGELLGLARVQSGNLLYNHFFFTLHVPSDPPDPSSAAPFTVSRVSRLFCIASTSPSHAGLCEVIQFVGGIHLDEQDQLILTYGANDCEPKVSTMLMSDVMAMLRPAAAAGHDEL